MTAVFVGGSRRITRLPVKARTRIDNVVDRGFAILVGDANGTDKAVQKHLAEAKYDNVTVYCSGDTSRNNVGQWKTRNVSAGNGEKNFQFYAAKDREMAQEADFGLMVWDGKSPGTVLNILRLVRASKKAVLVRTAEKSEVEFKSMEDWDGFLSQCSLKLRRDMERRAIQDELFMLRPEQDELNFANTDEATDRATTWNELKLKMGAALAVGDSKTFVGLLGKVAKQRGMSRVAQETGLAREALYRALSSDGNPEFTTIVKVTKALGLQLSPAWRTEETTGSIRWDGSQAGRKRGSRTMEIRAYRLFYDNIHDFKTTAVHVESEIRRHGICSDGEEEVPGMTGRTHHDMWASMKTVSHFNLGIAMESMFKLLLFLNKTPIPHHHRLAELHDLIPPKFQEQLEATYQDSRAILPQGYELVAFINAATPTAPTRPPDRDISSLRGFLKYLDEDVMLWQKRYSWELVDKERWRHYLSDISVFVELIERVMRDIQRY